MQPIVRADTAATAAIDPKMNGNRKSMPISRLAFAAIFAAGILPATACTADAPAVDEDAEPAAEVDEASATGDNRPADATLPGAVSGPMGEEPPDAEARPDRIYYDLMRYDWYAHGEPLVFDSASYEPDGRPVSIDARTLQLVGEYDGVDVYRRDTDPRLYVPVYDGYWLAFEPADG